jgi:glycosyltransferase involved in cell wall biosynthesis
MAREAVLKLFADFDVFAFPSLHDTGGYAVIEAMYNELPVICLDCGGPSVAVTAGCGTKIPLGARGDVIRRLSNAIRDYSEHRESVRKQGRNARVSVLQHYEWDRKGEAMNRIYEQTVKREFVDTKAAIVTST